MPLPSDEKLIQLGKDLIAQFDAIFGLHPGFRPAHAKGILLTGSFTPSPEALSLTKAPHIGRASTPVTVRFSDSTGFPSIPDNDPNANPHGMAVRFALGEHVHTDIIGHSADGFPTRTGQEFLEFLRAAAASDPSKPHPTPVEVFLGTHPAALAFVKMPKPSPVSYAKEVYFGVTALRFTNRQGAVRFGRYRILPEAGIEHLDETVAKGKDPDYLANELLQRLTSGPVRFQVQVQVAGEADVVDDATIPWPEDRPIIPFGNIALTAPAPDDEEHRRIIFDPIPRVDGIDPSDDPLLELRAAVYLMSGRRRRQGL
jgi:catalase